MQQSPTDAGIKPGINLFGKIRLVDGGTRKGVAVFIVASLIWSSIMLIINVLQPYQLSEMLGIPTGEQGRVTGQLVLIQNLCVILFMSFFGYLSDQIGRSPLIVAALLGLAAAMFLLPLAPTLLFVFLFRFLFGTASSAMSAGAAPLAHDYPANNSRGRFLAVLMVTQYLAAMFLVTVVGTRLPGFLRSLDLGRDAAGRYAYWMMALLGLLGAGLTYFGLRRDPLAGPRRRPRPQQRRPFIGNVLYVFGLARTNPRIEIIMLLAFLFRSEDSIIYSFLPLWVLHAGSAAGVETTTALADVGNILLMITAVTIVSSAAIGPLLDRFDRDKTVFIAILMTAGAYMLTLTLSGKFGVGSYCVFGLLAIAETAVTVGANALFGQEMPSDLRGSIIGIIALLGTAVMMLLNLIGGYIFDVFGPASTFAMMGVVNLLIAIRIGLLLMRSKSPALAPVPQSL